MIYGPIDDNVIRRVRRTNELCALCNELDLVKGTKIGRLCRIQELDPCGKLTLIKPEGIRRLGKPKLRWLASVEEDLKKMGVRNWRHMTPDREQCGAIFGRN